MTRHQLLLCSAGASALLVALAAPSAAWAQDDQTSETLAANPVASSVDANRVDEADVKDIIVTGSLLGAVQSQGLPVDLITTEDLREQGSPTTTELLRRIPTNGSFIGETSRSLGAVAPGNASINLRNLGSARTLTLMNGRRLADAANRGATTGANLRFIPSAAIGRIEVLRDGAGAVYGSDAVGGVINFITRTDLHGIEVSAENSFVPDTDGDRHFSVAFGQKFERGNLLLTAEYRHYSALRVADRDWAITGYENPSIATWSGASDVPLYLRPTAGGSGIGTTLFRDNGCRELGGVLTGSTASGGQPIDPGATPTGTNVCRFYTGLAGELQSEEDNFQFHGEFNYEISDRLRFHAEASYFLADIPNQFTSSSNAAAQYPTSVSIGGKSASPLPPSSLNGFVPYHVAWNNPGLQQLRNDCLGTTEVSSGVCTLIRSVSSGTSATGRTGLDIHQTSWRPIASAGHPLYDDGANRQSTYNNGFRASAGLAGELGGATRFDGAITFMEMSSKNRTSDLLPNRVQDGLNGFASRLGDPNQCTDAEKAVASNAGNAAAGCYWFNPFTNSIATSIINGEANPYYRGDVNAAVINDPLVLAGMYGTYTNRWTSRLVVADLVVDGTFPIELGGGKVQWGIGGQYRHERRTQDAGGIFDRTDFPCVDSIDNSAATCSNPAGALSFLGSAVDYNLSRDVPAIFAELKFPITSRLDVSVAARHERYGGGVGSTTDPRITARWQPLDWLTFRGSASKSFRAPPVDWLTNDFDTVASSIGAQFRSQRRFGDPNLKPEKADTYNLGFVVQRPGFLFSLDLWKYDLRDMLTVESGADVYNAAFGDPNGGDTAGTLDAAGSPQHLLCASPAELLARFNFSSAGCLNDGSSVVSVVTNYVNGGRLRTSGADIRLLSDLSRFIGEPLGTTFKFGALATYLNDYKLDNRTLRGAPNVQLSAAGNFVGTEGSLDLPRWRANFYLSGQNGPVFLRWQTRLVSGLRPAPGEPDFRWVLDDAGTTYVREPLGRTKDYWQHDLTARVDVTRNVQFTAGVYNLFDTDPPRRNVTIAGPLGRYFEIGFRARY